MKIKPGDFVIYENKSDKIIENCIVLKINSFKNFELQTIEVLDSLGQDTIRYFDNAFEAYNYEVKLITDKDTIKKLKKIMTFK